MTSNYNSENPLDQSCLTCSHAQWNDEDDRKHPRACSPDGDNLDKDKGYCGFDECIPMSASVPTWLDDFNNFEDNWLQNKILYSTIWKERPYINCNGWQPRGKDYDHTGCPDKTRYLVVYGRRYDDDHTVGDVQVSPEERYDDDHEVKSDKVLNFTTVTGTKYVILIPKKLKNSPRYGHPYELNKREGDSK